MKKFVILSNLRDESDIPLVFPECKGNKLPEFKIWSTFDVSGKAQGYIVVLGLTGAQVMDLRHNGSIRNQILRAVFYAQNELQADVIGLTSLTSSITMKGEWLANNEDVSIALTHGDAHAVALAAEGIEIVSMKMDKPLSEMTVGIIGAYGLIGCALSTILSKSCQQLILVGRKEASLTQLVNNLPKIRLAKVMTSLSIQDVSHADIVVTATSHPESIITAEVLKDNGPIIVYDVSVPQNLNEENYRQLLFKRPNLIRIDGSMASIPGIDLGITITGVPEGTTFACWAETMMQCLESDHSDHVGDISIEHVRKTMAWASKYYFLHAPFTCFGRIIAI